MSLIPGSRLGVYEITAKIGVDWHGRGVSRDSNLKRYVAIKVLPASVAGNADRLARLGSAARHLRPAHPELVRGGPPT